ncbi:Amino acid transporter [Nocardioides terrae]|uniref:Amino acid transporter n=1 Tax=Nocardioides terrae TaxID=574651 RepID=A0A1I1IV86_9ACTN|nr:APC family permease [Nocardioides terrae]SFC40156.1 Amino acid transporter [Nocardioides terrae]
MTSVAHDTDQDPSGDHPNLRRHVGVVGLLFASVGSIIGSGWLFGALNASTQAGPAATISWALGGFLILLIALVYAELGTMFPLSGGVVRYPHLSFGSFASYTSGWITWVAVATTAPIEVLGALQYATKYADFTKPHCVSGCGTDSEVTVHTLTAIGYVAAVVLMALFVVVNYFGIRWFARLNNVLVAWKLLIISVVVVAFLVTAFHGSNFHSEGFAPSGVHGIFSAIATGGIVFSFLGFRQGIELAGETDNPRRNVPIAVIGSVLITGVIYVLLQVAFIGALKPGLLSHGWSNLSFDDDFGPLAAVATLLGLGWLAVLLYIDAIVSPGDTGLIYTTITSRISYAMARNGNAPRALARTTDRGVPMISLIVTFVVGLVVFLPFPSWQQLVGFISSATVMSFASGPLVLAAMRKQQPDRERPFRLPGGHVIPVLAFWASNMIVYWSGWDVDWKLMVAVLIGFALLGIFVLTGQVHLPDLALSSGAAWVFPWLIGVTVISYLGSFPDPGAGNRGMLNFEWSAGLMGLLSIIVYVLAYRFRLSPEEAARHIEATEEEARVEDAELG